MYVSTAVFTTKLTDIFVVGKGEKTPGREITQMLKCIFSRQDIILSDHVGFNYKIKHRIVPAAGARAASGRRSSNQSDRILLPRPHTSVPNFKQHIPKHTINTAQKV